MGARGPIPGGVTPVADPAARYDRPRAVELDNGSPNDPEMTAMNDCDRVEIPTPFGVGTVNCYLFTGDGLTVLDPGPATDDAYRTLDAELERRGSTPADIDRIVVTHPHMDHFGLAGRLVAESGATVCAHAAATAHLEDPDGYFERERAFFTPFLRSMGVPADTVETVLELPEPYARFQEPVAVDRELADGDRLDVGSELTVVHTPGHSPSAICLLAAEDGVAFTGDHVLAAVTPNPLLTLAPGTDDERTRSLPTYLESLASLRTEPVTIGYGGHGEPMPDLPGRIDETIAHHEDRKERIAELLEPIEPATAYQLMGELFPDLPATELYPGMSEIIGHLDLLEDDRRVSTTTDAETVHYRLR